MSKLFPFLICFHSKSIKKISHIRSDVGLKFWSDNFRKWCGENKINFDTAALKHQEQNGLVERHRGTVVRLANTLLLHARLNRKFFYYVVKYIQYLHDVITVKDLNDEKGFPTTPFFLATNRKLSIKYFRTFGCPAVVKRYKRSKEGTRDKNNIHSKV